MQQRHGCHACEDLGCWATKPDCPGQLGRQLATINFAWLGSARICRVNEQLKNHVATYHQGPAGEPCRLRTRDFGGAGDCLFHSIAGALGRMLQSDDLSIRRHILEKIPLQVWKEGQRSVMIALRQLSAAALSSWTPENLLDYVLRASMDYRANVFEDGWNPENILNETGFSFLNDCESVLAVGEEYDGSLTLRVARTNAHSNGGARTETIESLEDGRMLLKDLREKVQEELQTPGDKHWGTQFDVKSLSDALNIGVLMFCDRLQENGNSVLYNIGSEKQAFPYWISLWWDEPTHFRLAELTWHTDISTLASATYHCFGTAPLLPPTLLNAYRHCNRMRG